MADDEYHQALLAHAQYLGMDPEEDEEFLWLAEEALKAELPPGWEMVMGEGEHEGVPFYYNEELNESVWEHPLDEFYREKFQRLKAEARERRRRGAPDRQASRDRQGWRDADRDSHRRGASYDDEGSYDGRRSSSRGSPPRRQARDGYRDDYDDEEDEDPRYDRPRSERSRGSGRVEEEDSFGEPPRRGSHASNNRMDDDRSRRDGGQQQQQQQPAAREYEEDDVVEVQDIMDFEDEVEDFRQTSSPPRSQQQQQQDGRREQGQQQKDMTVMRSASFRREEEEERRDGGRGLQGSDSVLSGSRGEKGAGAGDSLGGVRGSYYEEYDDFDDDGRRGRGAGRDVERERSHYGGVGGRRGARDDDFDDEEEEDEDAVRVVQSRSPAGRGPRVAEVGDDFDDEDDDDVDGGGFRRGAGAATLRKGGSGREQAEELRRTYSHLERDRSARDEDDDDDFDNPLAPDIRDRDRVAVGSLPHGRGSTASVANLPTPKSSEMNLAGMETQRRTAPQGGGEGVKELEQRLAEAERRAAEAEDRLRRAEDDRREAIEDAKRELERSHREEMERVREAGRDAQDAAIQVQADAWNKERVELIRMRRDAEAEATALEDRIHELEKGTAELKRALKQEQEEAQRSKGPQVEEMVERAKATAAREAREAAEEEWQKRYNDALKRAKDREQALEAQLESANARMEEMAEREGAGAAELEDDLRQLRQEADELRAAVEDERQARTQQERMAREALRDRGEELARLEATVEELREQNDKLLQESIAAAGKADKAVREAQQAEYQRQSVQEQMEALVLERRAAETALTSVSRELTEAQAMVSRLRAEAAEYERSLGTQKQELKRVQSEHGMTASRERQLEDELARVKEECEARVSAVERKAADLQNANTTLQRELMSVQDDANARVREAENARDLVDYEKKRAEERAAAAEQWRQKESARAKQAEQALEASRDELSNLREDMANVEQVKAKAQVPLKVRIVELERELEEAKAKVAGHDQEVAAIQMRHEAHIQNLKQEVSAKLPVITAAAIRKVEDEWKRRTDEECRMVREAGDREAEGSHLRVVALKSQLLEVQAKLQAQISAERMSVESLQRSLAKAEEDNRALRREAEELRNNHHRYYSSSPASGGGHYYPPPAPQTAVGPPPPPGAMASWEQAMQASMMSLLQGHLSVLQAQFAGSPRSSRAEAEDAMHPARQDAHVHFEGAAPVEVDGARHIDRNVTNGVVTRQIQPGSGGGGGNRPATHADSDMSLTTAAVLDEDDRQQWSSAEGMNKEVLEASAASTVSGFQSSGASSRYTEDEGAVDTFSGPGKGFYEGYWRAKYSRDNADVYGGGEGSVRWRAKKTTSFVQSFGGAVPGHYQTSLAAYATTMTASPVRTVAKKGPLHVR